MLHHHEAHPRRDRKLPGCKPLCSSPWRSCVICKMDTSVSEMLDYKFKSQRQFSLFEMFIDVLKQAFLHFCREIVVVTMCVCLVEQVVVTGRHDFERLRQSRRPIFACPFELERGLRGGSRECPFVMVWFNVPGRDMRYFRRTPSELFSGGSFHLPGGFVVRKGTSPWTFPPEWDSGEDTAHRCRDGRQLA
jgi:hypothetical protein